MQRVVRNGAQVPAVKWRRGQVGMGGGREAEGGVTTNRVVQSKSEGAAQLPRPMCGERG